MTRSPDSRSPAKSGDETRLLFLAQPIQATAAVAFVHGLGGHYYDSWGSEGHPGSFITRICADLPHVAVATFDYVSDLKRIVGDETLTIETIARSWARAMRESLLVRYRTVAIVAHCLGGLLTTMGLRQLLIADDMLAGLRWQENQIILFLLDAPHDLPDTGPGDWLAGLLGAFSFEPVAFRANAGFWRERILGKGAVHLSILAYAVTSEQESWVTPLHPDADLPEGRVCRVCQSHTELAMASVGGAFMPYDFVLARLRERL